MVLDNLQRQFLVRFRNVINFTQLEKSVGCPEKYLLWFVQGRSAFPQKHEQKLKDYLYPAVDDSNPIHQEEYQYDKVLHLSYDDVLESHKRNRIEYITRESFPENLVKDVAIIYFTYKNDRNRNKTVTLYSKYYTGDDDPSIGNKRKNRQAL